MIKLEDAYKIIEELRADDKLEQHILKGQVCGSYRRKKPNVNDLDWVIIPYSEDHYQFGQESLDTTLKRLHEGNEDQLQLGKKIKRFWYKGISIELYIANEKTFQTLILIRTGSKEHNVKLTTLAIQNRLKLYANGSGLCKIKGGIYNNEPEEIMEVIADQVKR